MQNFLKNFNKYNAKINWIAKNGLKNRINVS